MSLRHVLLLGLASCSPGQTSTEAETPASPSLPRAEAAPSPESETPGASAKAETKAETAAESKGETYPITLKPTAGEASPPSIAALCESLCVEREKMQAMAAEAIDAQCRQECTGIDTRKADPACAAVAKEFRATLEAKPMKARARRFWTLLADPELSCGSDPVLAALSAAWQEPDDARREASLRSQIPKDPWIELTCPAGVEALDEATLRGSVDALVERCPIEGATVGAPIHRDLDVLTFVSVEIVRTHWRALGATSSAHEIMLDTVLLSTALSRK